MKTVTARVQEELRENRVTVRKAAKIAGRKYIEMLDLATLNNIPIPMEPEDVLEDFW